MGEKGANSTMKFLELSKEQQRIVFTQASAQTGINVNLAEKDWWICQVLAALYKLPSAEHTSFKGGTSLSKCWKLIDRISEDIDIGIDREYLGFGGNLSKTQISDKLRRAACSFVRDKLQYELHDALIEEGITEGMFKIHVNITSVTTTDPEIIEVEYPSLFETNPYIHNMVRIEVSGRSMSEPVQVVTLNPIIDEVFPDSRWERNTFNVRAVLDPAEFGKLTEEVETLAGLLLEIKGDFPRRREIIDYNHYRFQVLEVDNRRILKVKFNSLPVEPQPEEKA